VKVVRPRSADAMTRMLSEATLAEPTYREHGASLIGALPSGYHHVVRETVLGRGSPAFARACEGLRSWQAHQFRGAKAFPKDVPLKVGETVIVTLGGRLGAIAAPCRIIEVVDEPRRFGFAYGTLPGHPEQGEESFVVSISEDDVDHFNIRAFSRAGDVLTRVAGPLGRRAQSRASKAYLRALQDFVASSAPG
jgi:uncharacterized protein (UPF0548 family)